MMSTITTVLSPSKAAAAALATIDLKGYDAEQVRLMEERCILVDEQDEPLGAADKKTCECFLLITDL
jgi:isopentenyl-diphosphate Delta-isomerase